MIYWYNCSMPRIPSVLIQTLVYIGSEAQGLSIVLVALRGSTPPPFIRLNLVAGRVYFTFWWLYLSPIERKVYTLWAYELSNYGWSYKSCITLRTLNNGNHGIFHIMGNAGFISSTVYQGLGFRGFVNCWGGVSSISINPVRLESWPLL